MTFEFRPLTVTHRCSFKPTWKQQRLAKEKPTTNTFTMTLAVASTWRVIFRILFPLRLLAFFLLTFLALRRFLPILFPLPTLFFLLFRFLFSFLHLFFVVSRSYLFCHFRCYCLSFWIRTFAIDSIICTVVSVVDLRGKWLYILQPSALLVVCSPPIVK